MDCSYSVLKSSVRTEKGQFSQVIRGYQQPVVPMSVLFLSHTKWSSSFHPKTLPIRETQETTRSLTPCFLSVVPSQHLTVHGTSRLKHHRVPGPFLGRACPHPRRSPRLALWQGGYSTRLPFEWVTNGDSATGPGLRSPPTPAIRG